MQQISRRVDTTRQRRFPNGLVVCNTTTLQHDSCFTDIDANVSINGIVTR